MQPQNYIRDWLEENANEQHCLFSSRDLRALFPNMSDSSFKALLSRSAKAKIITRVCYGIYIYRKALPPTGLLLFHTAALLRTNDFNYISLETVLSALGIISQIPLNWISIMSSGRSSIISCGEFGTIEFIHTDKKPADVMEQLYYDASCKLWRANAALALRDMKATRRNCDLIDWDMVNEFI